MSAACWPSFPHGWRSLPQSVQTGPPPQRAECVGAPVQTRERALRAPSRDWLAWWCLTRQREPARPLRCANRFAGYADASLCYRHISVARQAMHRCASTASDAGLAALTESLAARASRVGSRRKARPPRPMRAAADCAAWRRNPRSGYASRSCEAGPARGTVRQHTQTAAATQPDSGISVRCTSLRYAAASEQDRWPAATLRSACWHDGAARLTVLARSSLCACGRALLTPDAHNTYCAFAAPIIPGRSLSPTGPLCWEFSRTIWRCVPQGG